MYTENVLPDSKIVALYDAMIHCEIAGDKALPAMIWLHGNGEDSRIFNAQIRYFSKHYRTIAVDTRGHGQSTRGTAPFTFRTFAADLVTVFDALEIEKAHIIGFSDGAITALHMALTNPERISSMVLIGTNYNPKGIRLLPRLQIRLVYAWLSVAALFSEKTRKRKEIWGLMVNQPNLTLEELSRIKAPALIITGENDLVSQRHNDEINHAIVNSQRLVIPNGNHFWMFKQPETLNNCIMDFIASVF